MKNNFLLFSILFLGMLVILSCKNQHKEATGILNSKTFEEITVSQLQQYYKEKRYTVSDVVTWYLNRIDSLDKHGVALNSIITVNPDALAIADQLDKEIASGKIRGPLHGIPVILKDNINTHDKMPTTGGSRVLKNSFPEADSWVAKKLREAGAVLIAKANLSEWANFRSNASSSGWSGIAGQTKNPYVLDRNPCGSSSGSGVAVSANLCVIAIGTETNGSIVCPSNNNGIVGLKPTVGLISRSGIIPISFTQDSPGPMCRTVEDVAICLGLLTGIDSSDSKTILSIEHMQPDYTKFLKKDGLKGKRIGLVKEYVGYSAKVDTLMKQTIDLIKKHGAEVIEVEPLKDHGYEDASFNVLLYEFKDGIHNYFAGLGKNAPVKDLKELIDFNKKDPVELLYFGQEIFEMAQSKGNLDAPEYKKALMKMNEGTQKLGIDFLMNKYQLDALMAPSGAPAWKTDLIDGDHFIGGSSSMAAIAGYPDISVPMGFISGLPVGVSFFGKAWSEPVLIEIAYGFEQASKIRKAPEFRTTD